MYLNETDTRMFRRGAQGYGVEVYGGTPEQRRAAFEIQFDEPTVFVDAREMDAAEDLFKTVLLAVTDRDEEAIENQPSWAGWDLQRPLEETDTNLVILEFDSLPSDARTNVAQHMKALAENLRVDEVKLGFTSEEGGSVVHAEPDLRMRVKSWEIESEVVRGEL
ncbi:hypothetical protein [Halorubrum sp. Atlit-26R]|uniref:hypothetical protein n=1 Tax=Halorubrum sp. Atlit-26R TaxID=2282128 RepID=UPI000EF1D97D|nr:hypothetical protein [Halorubrum sp. Atlit-26R]RLM68583.1 hypothetical protein DVK07_10705 [Halorubrum sp. Atlit-26R]